MDRTALRRLAALEQPDSQPHISGNVDITRDEDSWEPPIGSTPLHPDAQRLPSKDVHQELGKGHSTCVPISRVHAPPGGLGAQEEAGHGHKGRLASLLTFLSEGGPAVQDNKAVKPATPNNGLPSKDVSNFLHGFSGNAGLPDMSRHIKTSRFSEVLSSLVRDGGSDLPGCVTTAGFLENLAHRQGENNPRRISGDAEIIPDRVLELNKASVSKGQASASLRLSSMSAALNRLNVQNVMPSSKAGCPVVGTEAKAKAIGQAGVEASRGRTNEIRRVDRNFVGATTSSRSVPSAIPKKVNRSEPTIQSRRLSNVGPYLVSGAVFPMADTSGKPFRSKRIFKVFKSCDGAPLWPLGRVGGQPCASKNDSSTACQGTGQETEGCPREVPPKVSRRLTLTPHLLKKFGYVGELIANAVQEGKNHVQIGQSYDDAESTGKLRHYCMKANRRAWQQPLLKCPTLMVAYEGVKLTIACLTLCASAANDVVLDLQRGASCKLVDCRLHKAAIRLGSRSSLVLIRTSVNEARGAGIVGSSFEKLVLEHCQVTRCLGDGLNLGKANVVKISDCTFADNSANGAVLAGETSTWKVDRCTFSGNGQFGVWADTGANIIWGPNTLIANAFGEKGGRGHLEGWQPGVSFRCGDECSVWDEDQGHWRVGYVCTIAMEAIAVRIDLSETSPDLGCQQAQLHKDLIVKHGAVRQPHSGDSSVPTWSKWSTKSNIAYQLFLRDGGRGKKAWINTNPAVRESFRVRAQKFQQIKRRKSHKDGDNTDERDGFEINNVDDQNLEAEARDADEEQSPTREKLRRTGKLRGARTVDVN